MHISRGIGSASRHVDYIHSKILQLFEEDSAGDPSVAHHLPQYSLPLRILNFETFAALCILSNIISCCPTFVFQYTLIGLESKAK